MKPRTGAWLPWHLGATRLRVLGSAASAVLATLAALTALLVAACSSPAPPTASGTSPVPTPATTRTSPGTSATAAPSAASAVPTTTALPGLAPGIRLAVKIDNTVASRPRLGLDRAAVVYVEPVEGGLTRVLAVLSSSSAGGLPPEVGPIRSARESDVTLLANYGHIALAYSGGSAYTRSVVDAADLATVSLDTSGVGYRRAGNRTAPDNVIGNTAALLGRVGAVTTSGDPGFRFGPPSAGGAPATTVSTAWPAARMRFDFDAGSHTYLVTTDGQADVDADGARHAAATIVVQHVASHLSQNRDVNGAQTPVVDVVGHGPVTVLRDGRQWSGQWSRPQPGAPTDFTAEGQPIAMAAGPVWVRLVPDGQAVTVS